MKNEASVKEEILKALRKAVSAWPSGASAEEKKKAVRPIWEEAIHRLLIQRGCPCQTGNKKNCFMALPPEEREKLISGHIDLSLQNFLKILDEAEEDFFKKILQEAKTDIIN